MQRVPRSWPIGSALALVLMLGPAAHAQTLKCKGDLVFADSLARTAILFVDLEQGRVTTPSCRKYPELRGFCAGVITGARDHQFVFGSTVSVEDSKIRIELVRTSDMVGTDTALNRWPRALFLGHCEPARVWPRHHRT
jgi:hypothetical protein